LLSLHFLEFIAARVTEAVQQIYRAAGSHFAQFDETLVRLELSIQDLSGNFFRAVDHLS
jgi:hypothetical protein